MQLSEIKNTLERAKASLRHKDPKIEKLESLIHALQLIGTHRDMIMRQQNQINKLGAFAPPYIAQDNESRRAEIAKYKNWFHSQNTGAVIDDIPGVDFDIEVNTQNWPQIG